MNAISVYTLMQELRELVSTTEPGTDLHTRLSDLLNRWESYS